MSHLSNPLATPAQLYQRSSNNALPNELQDSIRYHTARLTSAAGVLLRLPQDITAQANVLLYRYWLVDDIMRHEFSDISAATLYLTAKISSSPRSLRSVTNVYAYLLSIPSTVSSFFTETPTPPSPTTYYLSESFYHTFRLRILHLEGQILNALSFNTHVSLPYSLSITYLQTLDVFSSPAVGERVAKRTIQYLNIALWSPQMLYLTHQPNSLATAAIYMAAREEGAKLPECEWWEVFDVEREELGFLCLGMGSLKGVFGREGEIWGETEGVKCMLFRRDVEMELERRGLAGIKNGNGERGVEDEEAEMARMLDEKVGA